MFKNLKLRSRAASVFANTSVAGRAWRPRKHLSRPEGLEASQTPHSPGGLGRFANTSVAGGFATLSYSSQAKFHLTI